ncbi:hypothetical protein PK35_05115 [Tamlana nanhaiensis]|uniref:Glycosyl transferase family 1 domain-containing protein n=1 Tax=Neotamlana nanhaiensis TaxID=1382798 RepID=A0A0D7W4R4_9FLAO|nr:glycosyltransferase family 1 protein [Tamlana nanhaiensis]KJD34111.1 hypothetical protein PK35_05115 [Tamlana nanhaiensis]
MNSKNNIVINSRFLTQPITGVQRYAIEISRELLKSDLNIVFVAPKNIIHKDLAKEFNVSVIGNGFFKGHFWEQIVLFIYVLRKQSVLLSFCNTAPIFYKKQFVTIHDLSYLKYPKWFSKSFRIVYGFLIPKIIKNSICIFTVSEVSKSEIISDFNVISEKIKVTHNAIGKSFFKDNTSINKNKEKYILTVSSHHPRKNFKNLIKAFKKIKNTNIKLYVVGNVVSHFSKNDQILNEELNNRIVLLKGVSDDDLLNYYENAELFVYPSLYEGFGIPIIEAMSLKTQCAISDIPVFRELFKDNASYFNPESISSIVDSIDYQLENPKSEKELIDIKSKILMKYNWKNSSNIILEVLKEELNKNV